MESCKSNSGNPEVQYAEVLCSVMSPSSTTEENTIPQLNGTSCNGDITRNSDVATFLDNRYGMKCSSSTQKYSLGGITWNISVDEKMEDYLIFWIGQDNSAFANIVLTFNKCEIGVFSSSSFCVWQEDCFNLCKSCFPKLVVAFLLNNQQCDIQYCIWQPM